MKEKLFRQIVSQKSVMEVMENHLPVWESVREIRKNYDDFIMNIKKIGDCLAETETDLTPLKEKLHLSKESLIGQVLPVAGVLGVFAGDTGDRKLEKITDVKIIDLEKMKTGALRKYCLKVLNRASELLDIPANGKTEEADRTISGYGLTGKHLEKLQESFDRYCENADIHRDALKKIMKNEARLERHIRDNNLLLRKKMDRLILLFRETWKEFHDSYFNARKSGN